jgi:hypothetical protein
MLGGVDEADVVALHVALTHALPEEAAKLIAVFSRGHHGYLVQLPRAMVTAFSGATVDQGLVGRVDKIAATLRGEPKPPDWVQLSALDLRKIRRVCNGADGNPVFLYLSE